jgi:hypothetical protein
VLGAGGIVVPENGWFDVISSIINNDEALLKLIEDSHFYCKKYSLEIISSRYDNVFFQLVKFERKSSWRFLMQSLNRLIGWNRSKEL